MALNVEGGRPPGEKGIEHLALIKAAEARGLSDGEKTLVQKASGQFYTPEKIGRSLARRAAHLTAGAPPESLIDPFCGDGRLVVWYLEEAARIGLAPPQRVVVWDCDEEATAEARRRVESALTLQGAHRDVVVWCGDSFSRGAEDQHGLVITNPPWELVKPDRRELELLGADSKIYVAALRRWDSYLSREYPDAQPAARFAGWGTNLSRVGTELAMRLTAAGGTCAVVAPSSLFADTSSGRLRKRLFSTLDIDEITYYPAEARLFRGVDVPCVTFVARRATWDQTLRLTRVGPDAEVIDSGLASVHWDDLQADDFVLPVGYGAAGLGVLEAFADHPQLLEYEHRGKGGIWAGRELDETNAGKRYLAPDGTVPFVKGAQITRLRAPQQPTVFVDQARVRLPTSIRFFRLVWRDVSRPNQKRRVHATLIPPGWVTGNSLGVAHMRDGELHQLAALLGVFSSTCFEFQLRAILSTGHVSLSSVRRVRVPRLTERSEAKLAAMTTRALDGDEAAESALEASVAKLYGLTRDTWSVVLETFPKLTAKERGEFLEAW